MNNRVTGASCQAPLEPNTLHFVSDDELLFRTRELARHETELTIVTIQHLDEIERRELYDTRGYPSLFEYVVRELHYSKGCAWRRIMVMKLCRAVPGIADKLRSGELNLTTASQLQNAIEKRARKAARKAARTAARGLPNETEAVRAAGKAAVAASAAPTALAPAAASPTAGAARESAPAPPAAEPPPAWTLDQQVELVDLVANKSARETEKLLAELEPEVGLPRERQRALGGRRYELRVILDLGSVDTIAKLKGWLSHVNPGFTTGQLLAYLLQQAERKYDPVRERGRAKRGAAAPALPAETCKQQLGVTAERGAPGSALGVVTSKAGSSTCATGAPGAGEGVPASGPACGSVAAGTLAADAPALGSAAAGSADAGGPVPAPPAASPSVALAGGSAQNRGAQPGAAPGSEQDRRDTTGSAQNQQPQRVPAPASKQNRRHTTGSAQNQQPQRVPAPASEQNRRHTTGSAQNQQPQRVPAPASEQNRRHTTGSAQNQQPQRVPAPASEQNRRHTTGSAQNQQPQRAGNVGARTDTEPHDGVRAPLPEDGSAAPPPSPESSRARRARRHIPAAGTACGLAEVRWSLLLPGPAHRRDLWLYPPGTDRPHRAGGAGRQ